MALSLFVAGGTGYLGRAFVAAALERGHELRALIRPGSERKLPSGAIAVPGDALASGPWTRAIPPRSTFVHLVGTPKPAPWKARAFERVDLASARVAAEAARDAGCAHFVYVSVARPAPVMRAYQAARERAEQAIEATSLDATFLRPWYVLGPGHRWPYALLPMYALLERLPSTRESARRLGLVTHAEMTRALVAAVETPARGRRILDVEAIRALGRGGSPPV